MTRIVLAGLLVTACAGCSNVLRFDENPFSNPFFAKADSTGSLRKAPGQAAASRPAAPHGSPQASNAGRITSAPLPAPGTAAIHQLRPKSASLSAPGQFAAGAPDQTGSVTRRAGTAAKAIPGWSAKGGTPVTLGKSETVEAVANRYGVPAPALLHVNGLANSSQAVPGQQLIIPTYGAGRAGLAPAGEVASRLAALIHGNPFVVAGGATHLAFAGEAEDGPRDVLDDREIIRETGGLSFADQDSAAVSGTRKVRSVSSIAAPISIKPPAAVAAPKPAAAEPVVKAAVSNGPIKAAKPTAALKAAPAKPATRQAATKAAPAKAGDKPAHILAAAPKTTPAKIAGKETVKSVGKETVKSAGKEPVKTAAKNPGKTTAKPVGTAIAQKVLPQNASPKLAAPTKAVAVKVAPAKTVTAQAKPAAASKVAKAAAGTPKVLAKTDAISPDVSAYAADPAATGSLPPVTAALPAENGLFRWPAKGRVISSFGSKDISGTNNGINISMPEGTPVKAAEAGTVAYSGDDIKKYGKLVLIKHENGYVSAYAHNGELDVKKGEAVKRGQVIAKSGATGDVTSPQLHFQLRKGEQPIDPIRFLDTN